MVEIPLLDDQYREAFFYLLDEIDLVKSCSETKRPWYPKDPMRLEGALRVYRNWHPDPGKNPILYFPWPKPGQVPKVPAGYLKPTEEEKKKVRDFIEKNEGAGMDPSTEMIVQWGKDLLEEIH